MKLDALRFHRGWIVTLFLSCALPLAANGLLDGLRHQSEDDVKRLTASRDALQRSLDQRREDLFVAETLSRSMRGKNVQTYLSPADRTRLSERLEPLASAHHLDRLTYTLHPPEPWTGDPAFPGLDNMVQSRLTLEALAAQDGDVFAFLQELAKSQGRLDLQQLSIKRLTKPLAKQNIEIKAELLWIANAPEPKRRGR